MTQTRMDPTGRVAAWPPCCSPVAAAAVAASPPSRRRVHDELQAELDAALANLEKERKAKAGEEAARETAEGEVTRLDGANLRPPRAT